MMEGGAGSQVFLRKSVIPACESGNASRDAPSPIEMRSLPAS